MGMTLYIAQKLTEARMRDLRAASARTVLPGATGAAGSGKRLARLSSRPARTAAGARHGVPGEKT
jgi:hypothetical protein